MVNITKLYCGLSQPADHLRYGLGNSAPASASGRNPVVVWNITRRCNLKCVHCYSDSSARHYPGELDWDQCRAVIDDLADFGVPGLLFSGGEPLIHPRFFDLANYARDAGLRLTLSTNGASSATSGPIRMTRHSPSCATAITRPAASAAAASSKTSAAAAFACAHYKSTATSGHPTRPAT